MQLTLPLIAISPFHLHFSLHAEQCNSISEYESIFTEPKMNNDRDVLQAIFKYGNCMLILPKYDFVKNKVEISIWRVICSIVLILLTLLGFAISITGRIVESYDLVKGTQAFLDFSTYSLLTSINISIILEALLKRNAWEQLLKMLLATTVNVTRRQRLSYVFWFSLLHAYFLAVLIFDNYVWWHDAEAHLFKYYFLRILQEYPCLLMVFFTGVVNSMLRSRFEVLNTLLSNSTAFGCKNTISVISSKKHRHLGCASERFIYLYNAVVLFNRIYSWQNFLIVTYAVFSILDNLDKAMWYSSLSREGPVSYTKFFVCVSVASLAMVSKMLLIRKRN